MYKNLEKLLKQLGISTYKLCKETKIPQSTISDWKNGKTTPKYDKLKKIADYLGCTVAYLNGEDEETNEIFDLQVPILGSVPCGTSKICFYVFYIVKNGLKSLISSVKNTVF